MRGIGGVHGVEASAAEVADDEQAGPVVAHAVEEPHAGDGQGADFTGVTEVIGPDHIVANGEQVIAHDLHAMGGLGLSEEAPIDSLVVRHEQAGSIGHEPALTHGVVLDRFDAGRGLCGNQSGPNQGGQQEEDAHGGKVPPAPQSQGLP